VEPWDNLTFRDTLASRCARTSPGRGRVPRGQWTTNAFTIILDSFFTHSLSRSMIRYTTHPYILSR
jgi:hypothetical protein